MKIKIVITSLFLMLLMALTVSANVEPGIMRGKIMTGTVPSIKNLTDGNLSTSVTFNGGRYAEYTFTIPQTITGYFLVGVDSVNTLAVTLQLFDSAGILLASLPYSHHQDDNDFSSYKDIYYEDVKKVRLQHNSSIYHRLYHEFDLRIVEIDTTPPDQITGVKIDAIVNGLIVNWTKSDALDLLGYNVYLNGIKQNDVPLKTTSMTISQLTPLVNYAVQVTAIDVSKNESVKSKVVYGIPMNEQQKPILNVTNVKDVSLYLEWDKVGMSYEIYQDNVLIGTQKHAYTSVTKLEPSTEYTFHVVSIDQFYRRSTSNVVTVQTAEKELVKPTISVEKVTHNSAVVKWTEVEGSEYYDFFLNGEKLAYLQSNSYNLENLTPSTIFSVEVRVYRDGKSLSAFASFTTKKEPVPTIDSARVSIDPTDDTKRNLTYSHSNGVTAVDVYVNGQHIGTFPVDEPIQLDFSDITGKMAELEIKPVDPNGVGFKSSYPVETTGNGTIDEITNEMLGGLTTAEKAFLFLALISIPLLLLVLLFFWLRKRYKPMLLSADDKKPFAPAAATSGKANYSKAKSFSVDRTKDERFVYQPRQSKRAKVNKSNQDDNNVVNYFSYRNVGSKYNNPYRPKRNFGSNSNAVSIDKNQNKRGKYT